MCHFANHCRIGDGLKYVRYGFCAISAVLAGVLLALFFAWNGSQTFEKLEADKGDTPTFILITGVCALTIVHSIFSVMAGLVVEMLFMLSSVYNTV